MQFKVKITETFERVVCVDAPTESDSVVKVTTEYLDGKDALDENGLVSFKVGLYEDEQEKTTEGDSKC